MSAFKTWLNGLTGKTTPVDADEMYLRDSVGAASNKVTWANLKATLKTYFDGLYLALTGGTVAGGTRTTSGSTLTITETLNNAAVTFPGALVVDVTDTASASGSLLADFKVGGSSKFSVSKQYGSISVKDTNGAFYVFTAPGNIGAEFSKYGNRFVSNASIEWSSSSSSINGPNDLHLYRDAAGTLAQRNGANAQTYRNYGTYTDASNYRRVALAMTTAGVATLTPEGAGTGASGNVLHISGLPTSNPGAGILWNDTGTVKVGT